MKYLLAIQAAALWLASLKSGRKRAKASSKSSTSKYSRQGTDGPKQLVLRIVIVIVIVNFYERLLYCAICGFEFCLEFHHVSTKKISKNSAPPHLASHAPLLGTVFKGAGDHPQNDLWQLRNAMCGVGGTDISRCSLLFSTSLSPFRSFWYLETLTWQVKKIETTFYREVKPADQDSELFPLCLQGIDLQQGCQQPIQLRILISCLPRDVTPFPTGDCPVGAPHCATERRACSKIRS